MLTQDEIKSEDLADGNRELRFKCAVPLGSLVYTPVGTLRLEHLPVATSIVCRSGAHRPDLASAPEVVANFVGVRISGNRFFPNLIEPLILCPESVVVVRERGQENEPVKAYELTYAKELVELDLGEFVRFDQMACLDISFERPEIIYLNGIEVVAPGRDPDGA